MSATDDDLHLRRQGRQAGVGAAVAQPAAVTSPVAAGANPTKAEFDALRTDLVNTRATLASLLTSLKGAGITL